jgi:hypothetical protein
MDQENSESLSWSDFTKVKRIGKGAFGEAWLVERNEIQYFIKQIDASKVC